LTVPLSTFFYRLVALLQSTLRELLRAEGQLVIALGGKSVGKSFIMEKLKQEMNEEGELYGTSMRGERAAYPWLHQCSLRFRTTPPVSGVAAARKEQLGRVRSAGGSGRGGALLYEDAGELRTEDAHVTPRRVVIYDARLNGADLVAGLLKAFSRDTAFLERLAQAAAHVIGGIGGAAAAAAAAAAIASPASTAAVEPVSAVAAEATRNALLELFSKRPTPLADVVEVFIKTCEQEGVYPCLIVDEVSRAFARAAPVAGTVAGPLSPSSPSSRSSRMRAGQPRLGCSRQSSTAAHGRCAASADGLHQAAAQHECDLCVIRVLGAVPPQCAGVQERSLLRHGAGARGAAQGDARVAAGEVGHGPQPCNGLHGRVGR